MAIRSKQIGWSQESNLLWQISYQLDRLIQVAGGPYTTTSTSSTTTTTTTAAPGNVQIAASVDFDIDLFEDFTIEFFMNLDNTNGFPRVYSFGAYPAPNAVSIEGNGTIIYFWANGTPILAGVPGDFGINLVGSWTHVAIVREGVNITMYINGFQAVTVANLNDILTQGLPLTIGFGNELDSYFNGFLSNFRWTKGQAIYTSPFNGSVPTAPLSVTGSETKLLIFQGDSLPLELTDNSGNGHNASNVGAVYSTNNPFIGYDGSLQMGSI